ncbi:MAG: reverse transcriptase-like protein [Alphaproteobacteria bacterium]|nr:reverse transcriptase-like protein [Alphaproteobacteria bacterium]
MRVYTDASTRGGLSGIAFVVTDSRDVELYKKGVVIAQRDNNTAELSAVSFALEDIQYMDKKHVTIFTDSIYVINALRCGLCRKNEKELVNKIKKQIAATKSSLMWIKGHYQDGSVLSYYNKRADKMSKVVRRQYEKQIKAAKKARLRELQQQKANANIGYKSKFDIIREAIWNKDRLS